MASIKRNDLKLGKEIGSGGFGTVFSGIWKTENKVVAVKKLNKVDFQEINILKQLQHPNIVTLYGFVHEETDLMIVMELCEIGSLRSFLEQRVANPLPPSLIHDWMLQAALPIDHLRNHKIEHMDIKTDNYVITSGMVLKLTDFGLSQTLEKTRSYSSGDGSWRWMPPERLRDLKLSPKFSIYALALVFWCLFTRALPYSKYPSDFSIAKAVCDEKVRPSLPPTCPKGIWELIEACWHDDRSRRPDIKDVIIALILHKSAFDSSVKHVATQSNSPPALNTRMTQTKTHKCSDASTQTVSESCTPKDGTHLPSVRRQCASNEMHVEESLYVVPSIPRSGTPSYGLGGSSQHSKFLDPSTPAISYTTRGPSRGRSSKAAANAALSYSNYADALLTSPPGSTARGVSDPAAEYQKEKYAGDYDDFLDYRYSEADQYSRPKEPSVIVNQRHILHPPSKNDFSNVTDVVADEPIPRTHPARVQVGTSQSQPRYDLYSSCSSSRYQTSKEADQYSRPKEPSVIVNQRHILHPPSRKK